MTMTNRMTETIVILRFRFALISLPPRRCLEAVFV
jgi:hypothetical protein